ncbi:hypothetical protein D8I35_14035 [Corticibacter populi]|uniref:Uncharacterized protein n=2 Tax=Corticibacter populi TaxID=1550736 RepID=A0A3M6QPH4_9BURK|nr:hypothetical protein [Corticibacter populi]RMX04970.1 hypothetical protein D8I35_14035 [Corticibacter populi]RZS33602.1 hypothetical protein EV687_1927 [Corticibacter populi]
MVLDGECWLHRPGQASVRLHAGDSSERAAGHVGYRSSPTFASLLAGRCCSGAGSMGVAHGG